MKESEGRNYLDRRSISAILYDRDMRPFIQAKIHLSFFKTASSRTAYKWIRSYYDRYGKLPSRSLFKAQFPAFPLERTTDPVSYFADELIERHSRKILVETLVSVGESLEKAGDTRRATAKLSQGLEKLRLNINRTFDMSLAEDAKHAFKRYASKKKAESTTSMPIGFPTLDECTDGFECGQLTLLFGDIGSGKTWFTVLIALNIARAGFKVLYITKENKDEEIMNRVHARLCRVSPFRLRTGELTRTEEKRFRLIAPKRWKELGDRFVVSSQDDVDGESLGTEGVRQKILQYRPDFVVVDGLYLMEEDDARGPEWAMLRIMSQRLKRIARKEHVHIFVTTQGNASGAADEGGATNFSQIAFSRSVGMACDNVLNVSSNDELKANAQLRVRLIKQREGPGQVEFLISWDFNSCRFEEVPDVDTDNDEPELPA